MLLDPVLCIAPRKSPLTHPTPTKRICMNPQASSVTVSERVQFSVFSVVSLIPYKPGYMLTPLCIIASRLDAEMAWNRSWQWL